MQLDRQPGFEPSKHQNLKEKIGDIKDKITRIFNQRIDNKPIDTFQQLASIKIPEDQNHESPSPAAIIDQPPQTNAVQQNQQEISQLTQQIQQLQTESSPIPESTPKKLFPDRPSLYEQHHEEYNKERRTLKGQINRIKDIFELKKFGVEKATYTYDNLRSRGIPREKIMKNDTGEFPRISRILIDNWSSDIKKYLKTSYIDLPKNIDRLYSIGKFDSDSFSSDEKFFNIKTAASILSRQTDEQFQQTRDKLNNFAFLSSFDIFPFFYKNELPPDTFDALSYLKKEYFSDPQNEVKFDLFLLKYNISKDNLFCGLIPELYTKGVSNLVKSLIGSDINNEKKIDIPPELLKFSIEDESEFIHCLSVLKDREEQKFLVSKNNFSDNLKDLVSYYFDDNHQPNLNFYRDFISSPEPSNTAVAIPGRVIESISDPELKSFFEMVSGLPERQFQKYFLVLKNKNLDPNSYIYDGKLNFSFYRSLLCDQNFDIKPIPVEHLSYLPQDEQRMVSLISQVTSSSLTNAAELRELFFKNYQDFSLFFDKNDHLTSYFFETYVQEVKNPMSKTGFLENLSPELISTFSSEDQKLWKGILGLKNTDTSILRTIIDKHSQIDLYFSQDNQPTSFLFKNLIKDNNQLIYEFLKSNLTPELLSTFSSEDQKFWQDILAVQKVDLNILRFLTKDKDKNTIYFNKDHIPSQQLFEDMIKSDFPIQTSYLDFISANLNSESLSLFSTEGQSFWQNIANIKNNQSTDYYNLVNFLISNKENTFQYFDSNHQPNKKLIKITINDLKAELSFIKSIISPELINNSDFGDKVFFSFLSKIYSQETYRFFIEKSDSIIQKIISSKNPEECLAQYLSVVDQIKSSPSKEILKIKDQLLIEILNDPNPLEAYKKISDIFIKNNLPMVGKIYRVFNVLYPPEKVKQMLSKTNLSRVLINNHSSHLRQSIIFNDLLKVNLGSGESSLMNYLNLFQTSSPLLEKARTGVNLSQTETAQLSAFFKKLDTLYDLSLLSRLQQTEILDTSTLQAKITELYQKYKVKEGQPISDRVSEMYFFSLGIKSISEALAYTKQIKESAHQRNSSQTIFSFAPGDLIKGVYPENLGSILNYGCVSREYLGSDAGSDQTPFDTDTIKSDQEYIISDYQKIAASGYGNLFIVVKDRGQFQDTTDNPSPKYDLSKLEIFYSGEAGQQHYGVRTGFPSSEIDFLVATDTTPQKLENIFYEIAKHGVYIPVLDKSGNKIFTPTDYQRYRHSFDGVKQFSGDPLKIERSQTSDPFYQEIINLKKSLQLEPVDSVSLADSQIREKIKTIFDSLGISFKDQFDTSILGSRLYNIGSSGRHTNLPGDFDFDYNIVLDTPNYSKLNDIINEVKKQFPHQGEISSIASQIRLTGVNSIGSESIDLDIGINTTASTLIFASHEAIEQKLDSIKQAYGEDTQQEVIANILLAKKILKENHAYKKGEKLDGGFGGIGTENWILSNNGSIKKAFDTFWQAAHSDGQELSLNEFRKKYFILDSGENLRDTGRNHDNFIFALTDKGYHAMLKTIEKYVK